MPSPTEEDYGESRSGKQGSWWLWHAVAVVALAIMVRMGGGNDADGYKAMEHVRMQLGVVHIDSMSPCEDGLGRTFGAFSRYPSH